MTWSEEFTLLPSMTPFESARPPVTLTPATPTAAPVSIAFTTFPGLLVRYGKWLSDSFPSCGCDACRETAASEIERLDSLLGDVVAGYLSEELVIPLLRAPRLKYSLGNRTDPSGHWGGAWATLPRAHARAMRGSGPRAVQWRPWPRRGAPA